MRFPQILILVIAVVLILSFNSCGKKDKDTKMNDKKFVEYVVEYTKLLNEIDSKGQEIENNPKLVEDYNNKLKELEAKYPEAATYPTTLTQEQQNELGKKVDDALNKLKSKK
jgi:hypothetical protein